METLYLTDNYDKTYTLHSTPIQVIHFYNETGVIHSCRSDIKTETGENAERINVLQVLKTDKSFRKEETEQEFVNKQMKKKINFSYLHNKKEYSYSQFRAVDKIILYLYVDNEFIKVVEQKDRTEVQLCDYDLSRLYYFNNDITLDIDGQIVKHTEFTGSKKEVEEELNKQAEDIYKNLSHIYGLRREEFNKLFNEYEIVKRQEPLLK